MDKKKMWLTGMGMLGVIVFALLLVLYSNVDDLSVGKKTEKPLVKNEIEVKVATDGRVTGTDLKAFLKDEDFFDKKETIAFEEREIEVEEGLDFVESEELVSIDFLIHTVDEINELEEDAMAKDKALEVDSDDTESYKIKSGNAVVMGIDVSGWNGDIDWAKVKAEGIKYAIIRCGYRGYGSGWLVEDNCFQKNLKGAKAAGIKVGLYFFTQAIDENEAIEEAKTVVSLLGNETIDYPVFIDTEGSGSNGQGRADNLDVATRTLCCKKFCETIESYGLKSGVYASCNWFKNMLDFEELNQYVIWLAEYRSTPQFGEYYDMWQYTSRGQVDGVGGFVDLDVSYIEN